ncbi:MAG: phosphomannomutase/phosphoglucomutase [Patescibacteria group bacterium]|nr:phosphomannomutase/phosphoglucomutase [Patescibacteria group bacterium]
MQEEIFSVFKSYDIRGESPAVINANFAEKLGTAVVKARNPKKVMIGKDMRLTSPELEDALVKSLTEQGVDVAKIGLCSTPMFNILMGMANKEFDLGIMITASHNPGKYNGFKFVTGGMLPLGLGSGLEEIRDAYDSSHVARPPSFRERRDPTSHVGEVVEDPDALERYVDFVIEKAKVSSEMPEMKVVIDAGNGMGGFVLPKLLEKLPWLKVEELYFTPDGNFPNHEANPIKLETLTDLKKKVLETKVVMGIAFDGDADRIGFIDEKGEQIPGDILTALFASIELKRHGEGKVLNDVRSSWSVKDAIESAGGESVFCKVGHANIKNQMREVDAKFAGELSMHYYFREFWNMECGDYAMLVLLKELVNPFQTLSSLWSKFQKYHHSGEINFEVKDKDEVIDRLVNEYKNEATKVVDVDGIRLEFGDPKQGDAWWFNLRKSNTEPLIRLNLEATSEKLKNERMKELTNLINK